MGARPGEPKTSPRRIKAAKKRVEALRLREMNWTYDQIGAKLGVSRSRVGRMIEQELKQLIPEEEREHLRQLELRRLDRLARPHWAKATGGDLKSAKFLLALSRRRCAMLGLDKPFKEETGGAGARTIRIRTDTDPIFTDVAVLAAIQAAHKRAQQAHSNGDGPTT